MKNLRQWITVLLVLTLAFSTCLFSACNLIPGGDENTDPPLTDNTNKNQVYSLSFASGADDALGTAPETISSKEGSVIKLPENPFTREGYLFKGWADGSKVYLAGANYTVGNKNVVFTAVWEQPGDDTPTSTDLDSKFYDAANWSYMTNQNGESLDGGDIPYSMDDGSIKFHRANQAIEMGDMTNATVSFMLKGTNDWSIWFNSSSKDNHNNYSYRLAYAYGGVRISISSAPELAAAVVGEGLYKKGEWNRFDVVFSTVNNVTEIKLYINGVRATLEAGDNTTPVISVADNVLTHTHPSLFELGNYMVVKVWDAHNYVQLKPVAKAEEEDLPIIACIGASITEGAGATNFYTESYPGQLQCALDGKYNVINFGNSGKTVRDDLGEESWVNTYQWQGVQAIVPDIAILNIGTNDSKTHHNPTYDGFYKSFKNLVDLLLEVNPDMEIIICTVPYAYSEIWGINNDNIANIIAPVQRQIAKDYEFDLVDLYKYTQNKVHLFPDGVHPNTRGYEMIVKILEKAILEGANALTDEFIAAIDEEYQPLVTDAYVEFSSVVIKDTMLTVTGKTNDPGLKLYVGQNPSESNVNNYYVDVTFLEDESFTVSFDLKTMPAGGGWYNVRLYFSDPFYKVVSINDLTDGEGGTYDLWSYITIDENTKVQICTWNDGGIDTLSFKVESTEVVDPTYFLKGGRVSASNVPATLVQEGDKVYYTFQGEFNADDSVERTFELILTLADPAERPESLDESKTVYVASNIYPGDSNTAFSFKINATDDIGVHDDWIRLVLKVTEGDNVSYYTIKPLVPGHNGDWVACADLITLNGVKYEMAICWSSFFFQVKAG